jgi:hypothetical protein
MFHSGNLSCVSKTFAYARQYELLRSLDQPKYKFYLSSSQRSERENILTTIHLSS